MFSKKSNFFFPSQMHLVTGSAFGLMDNLSEKGLLRKSITYQRIEGGILGV